jgi:hypothetical protein
MKNTSKVPPSPALVHESDPILEVAKREASFEHAWEFAPIVKGPLFAVAGLVPLCCATAICIVWRGIKGLFVKKST